MKGIEPISDEKINENSIRPKSFDEYIGQQSIKKNLLVYIKAAIERSESLDHVLFYGPPGLGKTTLANIISYEMKCGLKCTSGPALEKPGDLASILTNLNEGDIFLIDEIHRLHKVVEEALYPALEDFRLDIIIGQGPSARTLRLDLPRFTLVGATTRIGLISSPLRDRFGVIHRVEYYTITELEGIIKRTAVILGISIEQTAGEEIAKRARGTPRIANRLLKRVRDFTQIRGSHTITKEIAKDALFQMDIDEFGLDKMDRAILLSIIEKFNGGPVGVETLATAINEEKNTIEDVYEPFLIQRGYINRTPRGRVATDLAYKYLGIQREEDNNHLQTRLF